MLKIQHRFFYSSLVNFFLSLVIDICGTTVSSFGLILKGLGYSGLIGFYNSFFFFRNRFLREGSSIHEEVGRGCLEVGRRTTLFFLNSREMWLHINISCISSLVDNQLLS